MKQLKLLIERKTKQDFQINVFNGKYKNIEGKN